MTSLGTIRRKQEDYAGAEAHYLEALSIYRKTYDEAHPSVVRVRAALAGLYTDWDKPGQAARYQAVTDS